MFFWASILTLSLALNGLCTRALALHGISYGDSLLTRGLFCVALVSLFAYRRGLSLVPHSIKTQLIRALVAGLALSFFTLSYNWLTASAVAVLSNIDVPLMIALGPWFGITAQTKIRALAFLSISFLVCFVINLDSRAELTYGLVTLGLGTLLLCFGYLFIKKSMTEENEAITIFTPSLAIIFYGLLENGISHSGHTAWSPAFLFVAAISGATMFMAYYATMKLYALTDLASAEFPTLISSILIQPAEALFLHSPLELSYLLSSGGFVVMTYLILKAHYRANEVQPTHAG